MSLADGIWERNARPMFLKPLLLLKDTQSRIAYTDVLQNRKFILVSFSAPINPTPPLLSPLYHLPSSLFSLLALRG